MRLFKIFAGFFLTFIVAINLVHLCTVTYHGESVYLFDHSNYFGFHALFDKISSFPGLSHTRETIDTLENNLNWLGTFASENPPSPPVAVLEGVIFLGQSAWFVITCVGGILLDIISMVGWVFTFI